MISMYHIKQKKQITSELEINQIKKVCSCNENIN